MNISAATERGCFVEAAGLLTHYHDVGDGPPVLLLHGSGPGVSAWANWRHNIPALAESNRVLAIDMLGFGQSERPDGQRYGTQTWTDHVIGFLETMRLDQVSVVGNSLGGLVALCLAAREPTRLHRMVLMGSGYFPSARPAQPTPALQAVRDYRPSLENMRKLLQECFAYDPTIVTEELVRQRYEASAAPGAAATYHAMFRDPERGGANEPLTEDRVRAIQTPTLLLHGREDKVVPAPASWQLLHLIPNAEFYAASACGHWFQIEARHRFDSLVREFVGRP
jgi:proline iminopeptidase/2-hydroxymuconate-semialdehyde hydrolase